MIQKLIFLFQTQALWVQVTGQIGLMAWQWLMKIQDITLQIIHVRL